MYVNCIKIKIYLILVKLLKISLIHISNERIFFRRGFRFSMDYFRFSMDWSESNLLFLLLYKHMCMKNIFTVFKYFFFLDAVKY